VVLRPSGRWRGEDDEWYVGAIVRPATEAEYRPIVDAAAARERAAKATAALVAAVQAAHDGDAHRAYCPADAGAESALVQGNLAYSHTLHFGADRVWYTESSYDDAGRTWTAPLTPALRACVDEYRAARAPVYDAARALAASTSD
jgi:hypothetical protein